MPSGRERSGTGARPRPHRTAPPPRSRDVGRDAHRERARRGGRPDLRAVGRPRRRATDPALAAVSPRRRAVVLVVALLVTFAAICYRLIDLQVFQHDALVARGVDQRVRQVTLAAERGVIFDRNGTPLAIAVPQNTIWADPKEVVDPAAAAAALAPVLGADAATLQATLAQPDKRFVYLARQRDDATAKAVEQLHIAGVNVVPESKRFYPQGTLAASVLGVTDIDNRGIAGLEQQYEQQLTGTPGELVSEQDPSGREIPQGERSYVPAQRGDDLVLTIDRALQYEMEQDLTDAVRDTQSKAGSMIVMDLQTGDVLAMATVLGPAEQGSQPTADGSPRVANPSERNRAVTDAYEPGSIMKVVTVAGALEDGVVNTDEVFTVPYQKTYYGSRGLESEKFPFTDHDWHPTAQWRVGDILRVSSNIGTIEVATRLGQSRLYAYQKAFGLGSLTGVDYPGEGTGTVRALDDWSETTLPSTAIGQGITTTEMQMLDVYATIANCGVARTPRLVKATVDADGTQHAQPLGETRQVVSPQTAATINEMLVGVTAADDGTGANARVAGYTVAGKTGTALKVVNGSYGATEDQHKYRSSFVGFLPAESPRLAAIVMLDEPAWAARYASVSAAPVFSKVMEYAVRDMKVAPPAPGARACDGAALPLPAPLPTSVDAIRAAGATVASTDAPGPDPAPEVLPADPSTLSSSPTSSSPPASAPTSSAPPAGPGPNPSP